MARLLLNRHSLNYPLVHRSRDSYVADLSFVHCLGPLQDDNALFVFKEARYRLARVPGQRDDLGDGVRRRAIHGQGGSPARVLPGGPQRQDSRIAGSSQGLNDPTLFEGGRRFRRAADN